MYNYTHNKITKILRLIGKINTNSWTYDMCYTALSCSAVSNSY